MRTTNPEAVMIRERTVPVVVLVSSQHGGLGIIRSLGRAGIAVYGVHQHLGEPAAQSRYLRRAYRWDFEAAAPEDSLHFLLEITDHLGGRPVLIPTSDVTAVFVAENAECLAKGFRCSTASAEVVRNFASKKKTADLCTRLGIPTPAIAMPACENDVLHFARCVRYPIIVKGECGSFMRNRQSRARVAVVDSEQELLEIYRLNSDGEAPTLLMQEYIPGGDDTIWMFNGYFNQSSQCMFGATGRKIHQYPIHRGATCLGICVDNETVFQQTVSLMAAVGYCGPLDIGYRFDKRDGKYKLLDVNPRIGATFRLFTATNELDVARAIYLDVTAQEIPPAQVCADRKWIVETNELVSGIGYLREGQLTAGEWLASLRGIQEGVFLSLDDPMPLLALPSMLLRSRHTGAANRATMPDAEVRKARSA